MSMPDMLEALWKLEEETRGYYCPYSAMNPSVNDSSILRGWVQPFSHQLHVVDGSYVQYTSVGELSVSLTVASKAPEQTSVHCSFCFSQHSWRVSEFVLMVGKEICKQGNIFL